MISKEVIESVKASIEELKGQSVAIELFIQENLKKKADIDEDIEVLEHFVARHETPAQLCAKEEVLECAQVPLGEQGLQEKEPTDEALSTSVQVVVG